MGKRSRFERVGRDFYPTPKEAVAPLIPHLKIKRFVEPCAGDGALISHLWQQDIICTAAYDIEDRGVESIVIKDALTLEPEDIPTQSYIITNPPWRVDILHPMIERFTELAPTWLLLYSDWAFTKQSAPYMRRCKKMVAVGRLKWIPGSKMTGKDNCAWYLFTNKETPTEFVGR
jgi:hypothetical protein